MAQIEGVEKIIARIDERMAGVAAERDKLDDLIYDVRDLREDCDNAWNNLQDARDALSELV